MKALHTLLYANSMLSYIMPINKLPIGEATFNHLCIRYKNSAKHRSLKFKLSKEQIRSLTSQRCFYCDVEPSQCYQATRKTNGSYTYNGIDRIDNTLGYVLNNCVTCCKVCNKMKGTLSHKEFIEHIKKISNRFT